MRILVVVHGYPPRSLGGAELYAQQHAAALHRAGHDVFVVAREADPSRPEYAVRRDKQDGVPMAWVNNTFRSTTSFEDSYRSPRIAAVVEGLTREWRPDVAHVHHLTCLSTEIVTMLARHRVPVVYTLHDYWLLCHRGQRLDLDGAVCDGPGARACNRCVGTLAAAPIPGVLLPLARAVEARLPRVARDAGRRGLETATQWMQSSPGHRRADADADRDTDLDTDTGAADGPGARRTEHARHVMRLVDHFLAPSHGIRDWFVSQGVDPQAITVWPLGLPQPVRSSRPPRAPGPLRIAYVGSLMVSKAPHVLLEAFAQLAPGLATVTLFGAHADYHGDDSYRARLHPLLSTVGVEVRGARPHDEVMAELAQMDVLVVPSIWPEVSPLVVHEALLRGVPVAGSRIGGIPELVRDGENGLLFAPGHVDELRGILARLIDHPEELRALSEGAAAFRRRSVEDDAGESVRLYARLVERAQHGAVAGVNAPPRRLAAVVVHHRTEDDTRLAVRSLLASDRPPDHLVLVENDDGDHLRGWASEEAHLWRGRFQYHHTAANLGFTGGVNVGVEKALDAGADAVLVLNSDAVVSPSCLGRLESVLDRQPDAGVVAPLVLSRSDPSRVASAGIDFNPRTGRMRERHAGLGRTAVDLTSGPRVAVSGCAMLVTRATWERAGRLDDRFFFGFEDIDLCLRARARGLAVWFEGTATAWHQGGGTLSPVAPRRFYFAARNHLLLSRLHGPRGVLARAARGCAVVGLNVAHALTSPGGSRMAKLWATARGTVDYCVGRTGRPRPAA